jgi:hypothetical protein
MNRKEKNTGPILSIILKMILTPTVLVMQILNMFHFNATGNPLIYVYLTSQVRSNMNMTLNIKLIQLKLIHIRLKNIFK